MKVIVLAETYSKKNNLTFIQWCAFASWFGMRPVLFERLPSKAFSYLQFAQKRFLRIAIGVLMLYLSKRAETLTVKIFFLPELLMLIGVSLILHFGILNIATAFWRLLGVDAKELFRAPYKSRSLKEFWGKRWNIAFTEMTALIVYRPLKEKTSPATAMAASFLLSGVLHEVAISFPVNSGYGLPFLYFVIHGLIIYLEEKSSFIKKINHHPVLSHVWVFGCLVIPMPLLFHAGFIEGVLKPLRSEILCSIQVLVR